LAQSTRCGHWFINPNDGFSAYFYQIVGWAMLFCPPFEGNSFKSSWAQKACPPYRAKMGSGSNVSNSDLLGGNRYFAWYAAKYLLPTFASLWIARPSILMQANIKVDGCKSLTKIMFCVSNFPCTLAARILRTTPELPESP
jgi:hypothetical protein